MISTSSPGLEWRNGNTDQRSLGLVEREYLRPPEVQCKALITSVGEPEEQPLLRGLGTRCIEGQAMQAHI